MSQCGIVEHNTNKPEQTMVYDKMNNTIPNDSADDMIETDSVPNSNVDALMSKEMRDQIGIRQPLHESIQTDQKKHYANLEDGLRQEPIHAGIKEDVTSPHSACADKHQNLTSVHSNGQNSTNNNAVKESKQGARCNPDQGIRNSYSDDDIAKVHIRQGSGTGTAKTYDTQSVTRSNIDAAISPQTAAQKVTVTEPHTPTQESVGPAMKTQLSLQEYFEDEHYDILLLHSEHDMNQVQKFLELSKQTKWKIATPDDFPPNKPKLTSFKSVFQRSTFTVLLLTDHFLSDVWCEQHYQMALVQSIEDPEKQYSVIPVICQDGFKMPFELSILTSVNVKNRNYERIMLRSISIDKRLQREQAAVLSPTTPTGNPPDFADSFKSTEEVVGLSLDEIYRRLSPELNPGCSAAKVLSDDLFRQLCQCLDQEDPINRDWRTLAEMLRFKNETTKVMEQKEKSPTAKLLECFFRKELAKGILKRDILKNISQILTEMQRVDAVAILKKEID